MQNDKDKSDSRSHRIPSVEETTAVITAEQEREETANSLPQGDKSATFETSNQSSSSENMERSQDLSDDRSEDQCNQAARCAHSSRDARSCCALSSRDASGLFSSGAFVSWSVPLPGLRSHDGFLGLPLAFCFSRPVVARFLFLRGLEGLW
jgi:hypothetical protein